MVISSTLGRDLLAFRSSQGHSLQRAFAHAQRNLRPADRRDWNHTREPDGEAPSGLSAGLWLQAMQRMLTLPPLEAMGAAADLADPAAIPPLAEASSGLPPFWMLCRPIPLQSGAAGAQPDGDAAEA
ncbi:MAG: hypothetical protein ACKOXO_12605 [Cyanobium sp.]